MNRLLIYSTFIFFLSVGTSTKTQCQNQITDGWDMLLIKGVSQLKTISGPLRLPKSIQNASQGYFPEKGFKMFETGMGILIMDEPTAVFHNISWTFKSTGVNSENKLMQPKIKEDIQKAYQEVVKVNPKGKPILILSKNAANSSYQSWKNKGKVYGLRPIQRKTK